MFSETGGNPEDVIDLVQRDINNKSPDRDTTPGLYGLPFHANETWSRFSSRDIVRATIAATNADGTPKYPLALNTQSLVTRVLFDQSGRKPKAAGVEYLAGSSLYSGDSRHNASASGTKYTATARREVIASGGVFNPPQLLQLSGICGGAELALHNIPLIADLPGVGTRLQDNYELPLVGIADRLLEAIPTPGDPSCTFGTPDDPCIRASRHGEGPYARVEINSNAFL